MDANLLIIGIVYGVCRIVIKSVQRYPYFSKGEKWYDKLLNVKYLPLFHHFKAIYQFPKHIIFLVKIVAIGEKDCRKIIS
jgi:hypothetical protein